MISFSSGITMPTTWQGIRDGYLTVAVRDLSAFNFDHGGMRTNASAILCVAALALAAGIVAAKPAGADQIGHERARRLVQEGKIKPLQEIIDMLREKVPGRVLETELEDDDEGLVYDFKILRPGGRIQEVEVLATTGKILKIEDDD